MEGKPTIPLPCGDELEKQNLLSLQGGHKPKKGSPDVILDDTIGEALFLGLE
jgi:hypothetical protein